jgi:outer membrane protein OmpA-like peptidoglycan-associated protein
MTLECSIDGGPFHECTSGLSVGELSEGWHVMTVRQVDEAGSISPVTTYRWDVVSKAPPKGKASKLTARLGARATVRDDRSVGVGCLLNGGWLRTCTVRAYHYAHGQWVEVGTGRVALGTGGDRAALVRVLLNTRGQRMLASRLGGLGVTLQTRGETFAAQHLHANQLKVRLYPQQSLVIPIVWPFETARSQLVGQAWSIVQGAAREILHARRVTCIGYTDSTGGWAYNIGLGQRRAATVCEALRDLGVHAAFRLETRGAGRPRSSNQTAIGRALNRRVELRVSY